MTKNTEDTQEDKPPFFDSWSKMYWLLMAVLGVMVLLFYLFTVHYS